ncbi:hypothetical protein ABPG75_012176 [Micractinium tetrahymenae]
MPPGASAATAAAAGTADATPTAGPTATGFATLPGFDTWDGSGLLLHRDVQGGRWMASYRDAKNQLVPVMTVQAHAAAVPAPLPAELQGAATAPESVQLQAAIAAVPRPAAAPLQRELQQSRREPAGELIGNFRKRKHQEPGAALVGQEEAHKGAAAPSPASSPLCQPPQEQQHRLAAHKPGGSPAKEQRQLLQQVQPAQPAASRQPAQVKRFEGAGAAAAGQEQLEPPAVPEASSKPAEPSGRDAKPREASMTADAAAASGLPTQQDQMQQRKPPAWLGFPVRATAAAARSGSSTVLKWRKLASGNKQAQPVPLPQHGQPEAAGRGRPLPATESGSVPPDGGASALQHQAPQPQDASLVPPPVEAGQPAAEAVQEQLREDEWQGAAAGLGCKPLLTEEWLNEEELARRQADMQAIHDLFASTTEEEAVVPTVPAQKAVADRVFAVPEPEATRMEQAAAAWRLLARQQAESWEHGLGEPTNSSWLQDDDGLQQLLLGVAQQETQQVSLPAAAAKIRRRRQALLPARQAKPALAAGGDQLPQQPLAGLLTAPAALLRQQQQQQQQRRAAVPLPLQPLHHRPAATSAQQARQPEGTVPPAAPPPSAPLLGPQQMQRPAGIAAQSLQQQLLQQWQWAVAQAHMMQGARPAVANHPDPPPAPPAPPPRQPQQQQQSFSPLPFMLVPLVPHQQAAPPQHASMLTPAPAYAAAAAAPADAGPPAEVEVSRFSYVLGTGGQKADVVLAIKAPGSTATANAAVVERLLEGQDVLQVHKMSSNETGAAFLLSLAPGKKLPRKQTLFDALAARLARLR